MGSLWLSHRCVVSSIKWAPFASLPGLKCNLTMKSQRHGEVGPMRAFLKCNLTMKSQRHGKVGPMRGFLFHACLAVEFDASMERVIQNAQ